MKKIFIVVIVFLAAIIVGVIFLNYLYHGDAFDKDFLDYFEKIGNDIDTATTTQFETAPSTETVTIPILVYHSIVDYPPSQFKKFTEITVPPEMLEKQMRYLKENHYHIVPFQSLLDYFSNNAPLPPKPIIITFDDGWESQYIYALPILERYDYTATFFVFTNAIGHKHFMTWDQLQKLDAKNMTIGGHTKSHPYLIKILDENKLRDEIIGGKKIIEERIGKPINIFAYPFGHYNNRIIDIIKEAGYTAARSTYKGSNQAKNNLFALKGILMTNNFESFIADLKK